MRLSPPKARRNGSRAVSAQTVRGIAPSCDHVALELGDRSSPSRPSHPGDSPEKGRSADSACLSDRPTLSGGDLPPDLDWPGAAPQATRRLAGWGKRLLTCEREGVDWLPRIAARWPSLWGSWRRCRACRARSWWRSARGGDWRMRRSSSRPHLELIGGAAGPSGAAARFRACSGYRGDHGVFSGTSNHQRESDSTESPSRGHVSLSRKARPNASPPLLGARLGHVDVGSTAARNLTGSMYCRNSTI